MNLPEQIAQSLNDEAVGAALLLELDTAEGFLRLYPGENGVFRDANKTDWIGCSLLRMGEVKISVNGTAPTWEAQLAYPYDPNRQDLLEVIRQYGLSAIDGRPCALYFQYFGQLGEMFAPIWQPIKFRTLTMRKLIYAYNGDTERSVTLLCEGPFPLRSRPRNGRYTTADQQRRFPGDLGLEFMPTNGFDDEPLFGA